MKKLKIKLAVVLIIVVLMINIIGNIYKVEAFSITSAELYSKGAYSNMIRYNGVEVLTTFVVYQKDGVEYPAYCMDKDIPGVGETSRIFC